MARISANMFADYVQHLSNDINPRLALAEWQA
jgi:hypothetical protein